MLNESVVNEWARICLPSVLLIPLWPDGMTFCHFEMPQRYPRCVPFLMVKKGIVKTNRFCSVVGLAQKERDKYRNNNK